MKASLRNAVNEHYSAHSLSAEQLERLQDVPTERVMQRPRRRWLGAVAAGFVIGVIVLTSMWPARDMPQEIASEVARYHVRLKPLDIETANMAQIRSYFTELDFKPFDSRLLASSELQLLGGRHCSVQSIPAAQLRLQNPSSGSIDTIYQLEYDAAVFGRLPNLDAGEEPVQVVTNGVNVQIWVENGVLVALARDAASY